MSFSSSNNSVNNFVAQPLIEKTLHTPNVFSFIYNLNDSLDFFDKFSFHSKQVDNLLIDMKNTDEMTIEVLLYLISLDKINENQNININLAQASIMKAVLEGEYRSATNKPNRNKGLPQINNFLKEKIIELPIILTNKIYYLPQEKRSIKANTNFRGTLFVWMLKKEENV